MSHTPQCSTRPPNVHTYCYPTLLWVSHITWPVQWSFRQQHFTASLISPTCSPSLPHILHLWCTDHCCQEFILHSFQWHDHSEQSIGKIWKYRHGLVSGTTAPFAWRPSGKLLCHNCWCPSKWYKTGASYIQVRNATSWANWLVPKWSSESMSTCNILQGFPCYEQCSIFKLSLHQQLTCSVSGDVPSQTADETAGTSVSGTQRT